MSYRDAEYGVGVFRDGVRTSSIDAATDDVLTKARLLAWKLHGRSADEKLSDAEVDLLNAFSVLESYKIKPWGALTNRKHRG